MNPYSGFFSIFFINNSEINLFMKIHINNKTFNTKVKS